MSVSYALPGSSAQYELRAAHEKKATSTKVNCGCAATKLLSCSRDVEIVATQDSRSRKPATFRKLKDRSSLTSSSSREREEGERAQPEGEVPVTSTSMTKARPKAPAIAYVGFDAREHAHPAPRSPPGPRTKPSWEIRGHRASKGARGDPAPPPAVRARWTWEAASG